WCFFFKGEDGIRDWSVTGVQTCALPIFAAIKGGNRLFHNVAGSDGAPRFVEVTEKAGIPSGEWSSMAAVADYDRDGFLDVYVVGSEERRVGKEGGAGGEAEEGRRERAER